MYIEHNNNPNAVAKNSIELDNVEFTNSVTKKPAIVLTYGAKVVLNNNTYPDKGVFELDKDGKPDGTAVNGSDMDKITCVNDDGKCGAFVGNSQDGYKIYTKAEDAVKEVEKGDTLVVLAAGDNTELKDIPDGAAVVNKSNKEITVNGEKVAAGKQYGEVAVPTPTNPQKPVPDKSPNTGDNSMAPFAVAGLVMAAMAAVVATNRIKYSIQHMENIDKCIEEIYTYIRKLSIVSRLTFVSRQV